MHGANDVRTATHGRHPDFCSRHIAPSSSTGKMGGNHQIPNAHFKKKWHNVIGKVNPMGGVKTWFNQPARKVRRRNARAAKAAAVFPRPASGPLRPVVRGQTVKYNMKRREGRGFTLEELKEAGIPAKFARTIGIAVDSRRRNRSLESLQDNVNRLKAYKAALVVFPRRANKPKNGDSTAEECAAATQHTGALMPVTAAKPVLEKVAITDAMKSESAYATLRLERMNKRMAGIRKKRAEDAAAADKDN